MPFNTLTDFAATTCILFVATAATNGGLTNLVQNGDFSDDTTGWTLESPGDITHESTGGPDGGSFVRLTSTVETATSLTQTISGLQAMNRYTICAKVRGASTDLPPTLTVSNGVQEIPYGSLMVPLNKAKGYLDTVEVNQWVEWRFEFFVGSGSTSVDVALISAKVPQDQGEPVGTPQIDFADIRVFYGRLGSMPDPEPWRAATGGWTQPPEIIIAPEAGGEIVRDGGFTADDYTDKGDENWVWYQCSVIADGGTPFLKADSTDTTATCSQAVEMSFPPNSTWTITCEGKVDENVVGTIALEGEGVPPEATASISAQAWTPYSFTFTTGDAWVNSPNIKISCWKDQGGSAYFRNVSWIATGSEWTATTDLLPVPQHETFEDDFSSGLSMNDWLVSNKGWGGDNGGVWWENVSVVDDTDDGVAIKALRLQANGDLYDGPIVNAGGAKHRVGSAVATRQFFASGRYTVRAKITPQLGACTAFWPFMYQNFYNSQEQYWYEANPRRNTEIDWEFPTDLRTDPDEGTSLGIDPDAIAMTNARCNAWGGQFGGEGGNYGGRKVLVDPDGNVIDLATAANNGKYYDFIIEWNSGEVASDNMLTRDTVGSVKWYIDDTDWAEPVLVDQLDGVSFGQGNVPYRGARFWLGVWFPGNPYFGDAGWAGTPDFDSGACYIASVKIEPISNPRDTWESETVPNRGWATPDEYPDGAGTPQCVGDITGSGDVGMPDLTAVLDNWGQPGSTDIDGDGVTTILDLIDVLRNWGPC
ncbi:MAG: glycoside hydrolase family 16 protein [Phycisphaerales bacterium]|nr:glycoside hydrolase family 16 protein [Phycisphaerales bacterium]